MIHDPTPRWRKVGDAISQLGNVLLMPRHTETTSDESISGRAHRMGWQIERWIDAVFAPFERDHCRKAYEADVIRARNLIEAHHRASTRDA